MGQPTCPDRMVQPSLIIKLHRVKENLAHTTAQHVRTKYNTQARSECDKHKLMHTEGTQQGEEKQQTKQEHTKNSEEGQQQRTKRGNPNKKLHSPPPEGECSFTRRSSQRTERKQDKQPQQEKEGGPSTSRNNLYTATR